jgi:hypothetical protein
MFAVGEDINLELLTQGPAPKRLTPVYEQAPYFLASSSTSDGVCSGLNSYAGSYHRAAKTKQGILIGAPIFQPSAETLSSSTLAASPDQDFIDDYPEIGRSICWNSAHEGHLIIMVTPTEAPSQNISSKYPTIERSEASDAQTSNDGMIQNLNPDFNAIWIYTIIESIQRMTPEGSPLVALAQ